MANDESKKLAIEVIARVEKLEKGMARAKMVTSTNMGAIEKRAATMTSRLDAQFSKIGSGLGSNLLGFFKGVGGGALAALGPIALFNTALKTIDDASHLVDTADRIGLSTTALQELGFGFAQAGVEAGEFETAMEQFSKRIGEAATKGGRLADILKANGVALRDSNGQIKSSEQLLGSYADLVRNAASEQEKMVLTTEAFGRGGGAFLNALNDGAKGIENMKRAAEDAGGVIDEELLRRAEAFGDRWDAAWRQFTVSSQSAILTAIEGLDSLNGRMKEFMLNRQAAEMGSLAGSLVGKPGDVLTGAGKTDKPGAIDTRIAAAFGGEIDKADDALVAQLKARYGDAAKKATIIPPSSDGAKGGGRNAAVDAAIREAEAVLRVIESLKEEQSLIGATDARRATANALRQAGSAATAEQRAEIEMLVTAIYAERDARDAAAKAAEDYSDSLENVFDLGADALESIVDGSAKAEDAVKKLAVQLAIAAAQAALLGTGPLAGIFGGGLGGSSFNPTPGGFAQMLGIPGYASGTNFHPGGMAIVGEKGPELLNLPRGAQVMPSLPAISKGGSSSTNNITFSPSIVVQGGQGDSGAQVTAALKAYQRDFTTNVVKSLREAKTRGLV